MNLISMKPIKKRESFKHMKLHNIELSHREYQIVLEFATNISLSHKAEEQESVNVANPEPF
jgi:hypothetical protein